MAKRKRNNGSKEVAKKIKETRAANSLPQEVKPSSLNPNATGLKMGGSGRPEGLAWDNRREPDPVIQREHRAAANERSTRTLKLKGVGSEYCEAELHLLSKHGRESKTAEGGRVCEACINETTRQKNHERYAKQRGK